MPKYGNFVAAVAAEFDLLLLYESLCISNTWLTDCVCLQVRLQFLGTWIRFHQFSVVFPNHHRAGLFPSTSSTQYIRHVFVAAHLAVSLGDTGTQSHAAKLSRDHHKDFTRSTAALKRLEVTCFLYIYRGRR